MNLMLELLRNILRDDFSEDNAKPYQSETRAALLNLCSYAYDHEVRLAARMALDYVSARVAVSSNDLRRIVPFRRRNEGKHVTNSGHMLVGLLDTGEGADPMAAHFAVLAGNTRAYETGWEKRLNNWSIAGFDAGDAVMDALSDYRLPPSIHDLFVNDHHRRFYQRLHRRPLDDEDVTGRNCDNDEIYAGSPSYLISAGGSPATFAIDPAVAGIVFTDNDQQKGVAVTTSFMPTGNSAGFLRAGDRTDLQNHSRDLFQLSKFSDEDGAVQNYGVAPDFACGSALSVPNWGRHVLPGDVHGMFQFLDRGSNGAGPGFYLAIYTKPGFGSLIEAFDTWLHQGVPFSEFVQSVLDKNGTLDLPVNADAKYTTFIGNRITFQVFDDDDRSGARIVRVDYSPNDPHSAAGNAADASGQFLHGTILNGSGDGVVQITNPFLGTTITLDMQDAAHPKRISESGEVEQAGSHEEVWVDFAWDGEMEGDFFHPFNTLSAALAAVSDGGVIKIVPGQTAERPRLGGKRVRIVAPTAGVAIGIR